ncbi:hypothetical protein BpHYR1_044133 [Brachionus plicatilis]|uniref:Uncharacterized protein n=1 Tax=Brachionus plicatilis TaxID=10195 RepID=A0A3M7S0D3_BRAPC|nr:hypothetical protein BpHYR1_044133 [Brachionus plicatilis]
MNRIFLTIKSKNEQTYYTKHRIKASKREYPRFNDELMPVWSFQLKTKKYCNKVLHTLLHLVAPFHGGESLVYKKTIIIHGFKFRPLKCFGITQCSVNLLRRTKFKGDCEFLYLEMNT